MKISFLDGLSNMKRKVILSSASVAKEKSYPGTDIKLLLKSLATAEGFRCKS